ncbi:serine hydrolase (plasmid) [Klebsiella pneumoniae]
METVIRWPLNRQRPILFTKSVRYRKVLTGLLLSLLSLEGLVSLDTPVQDVLPAGLIFPDTELATATLFDLASHYSGLPSVPPSILSALLQNPYRDFDVCAMKDYLESSQTVTPPGTQFEYSNHRFYTLLPALFLNILLVKTIKTWSGSCESSVPEA